MQAMNFVFTVAGVCVSVESPVLLNIPQELIPFLTPQRDATVFYQIELIDKPIRLDGSAAHSSLRLACYPTADGWLRSYPHLTADDGCQAVLSLRNSGRHTLYLPRMTIDRYQGNGALLPLLGLDYVLMQNNCLLLHSSVVEYAGKMLLFSGDSGVGKSTQADLWHQYKGAAVRNGDRCALSLRGETFWGSGCPYAGSSGIYDPAEAPLAGIVFLEQGPENRIRRLSGREAFTMLFAQSLANPWDAEFTDKLCDLISGLIKVVPIYQMTCTADGSAVELVHRTIF